MVTAAIVGAAVAGVAGSAMQAGAASDAANTQAAAAQNAQQISLGEFNTITGQEQPFMQGGYGALNALEYGLGIPSTAPSGYGGYSSGNGYDPSSGYTIGPNGSIGQLIPGGGTTTGYGGGVAPSGGFSSLPGLHTQAPSMHSGMGGLGGAGMPTQGYQPRPGSPSIGPTGAPSTQPGGIGYGSLLTPFTAENWKELSPSYGFQLQQGQQGTLNAASANGGALSGAAQKDLMEFNQGLAGTSFNNAFNMYQTQQGNIYQRLAGLTQLGQSAAANTGQQGTALAGQAAQSAQNIGTAQAAGQIGAANAYASGLSSAGSYLPWLYQSSQSPAMTYGGNTLDAGGGYTFSY